MIWLQKSFDMLLLLVVCLKCAYLVNSINTCNCMPVHPQQAYCNSDFVIRAKVLKDRWNGKTLTKGMKNSPRYDLLITSAWKGKGAVEKALNISSHHKHHGHHWKQLTQLYTSPFSCTLELTVGARYVLTGAILQNRLYMTRCHWRSIWNSNGKTLKKYLKGGINCKCEIQPCFGGACNRVAKSCQWDLSLFPPPCSWRLCDKVDGVCTWSKNTDINLCEGS